jgi:hypothetical protein
MIHPDIMHIIVDQYQESQRSLASEELLIPGANRLARTGRRHLGTAMIRLGSWLGGYAPVLSDPAMSTQET